MNPISTSTISYDEYSKHIAKMLEDWKLGSKPENIPFELPQWPKEFAPTFSAPIPKIYIAQCGLCNEEIWGNPDEYDYLCSQCRTDNPSV